MHMKNMWGFPQCHISNMIHIFNPRLIVLGSQLFHNISKRLLWWYIFGTKVWLTQGSSHEVFSMLCPDYNHKKLPYIANILSYIGSYKNCMNSMLWLIWTIFECIQYFKYSNWWDIFFNEMCKCSCLIHKNRIVLCKITSQ
jgi:hypothetical protein